MGRARWKRVSAKKLSVRKRSLKVVAKEGSGNLSSEGFGC